MRHRPTQIAAGLLQNVVYKKDGTIMRGTIIERVPNGSVEIMLPNGQSRKIDMKDVEYAGPVSETPAAKAQAEAKAAGEGDANAKEGGEGAKEGAKDDDDAGRIPVRLTTTTPKTTILVEAASASYLSAAGTRVGFSAYAPVCEAPCDRAVIPGTYKLALARDEEELLQASTPVTIADKPVEVEGKITSRAGIRTLGWVVGLGGAVAGTYLFIDSLEGTTKKECSIPGDSNSCTESTEMNLTEMLIGTGLFVVGVSVGGALVATKDKATFTVRPLSLPANGGGARASASSDPMNLLPHGVAMAGRF
ncbi:MAG: hypothetical protein QM784_19175 [Polyangiaceae bacterium]